MMKNALMRQVIFSLLSVFNTYVFCCCQGCSSRDNNNNNFNIVSCVDCDDRIDCETTMVTSSRPTPSVPIPKKNVISQSLPKPKNGVISTTTGFFRVEADGNDDNEDGHDNDCHQIM